ncbi:hypothetical protein [Thermovirga lienii]|jgi:hypothetical protein|uniref:hypothetical protein n=1 Tax=Thermovirga lienii TaxID=336261 RepID=UPI002FDF2199
MKLKAVILMFAFVLVVVSPVLAQEVVFSDEARKAMAKMGNEGYISLQNIGSG